MQKLNFVFCIFASLSLFIGCSKKAPTNGTSRVSFSIPETFAQKNGAFSNSSCFAVSITAPDIPMVSPSSCDSGVGTFAGLVPLGGNLEIEASFGTNRTIDIFLISSQIGCPSFDPALGLGKTFGSDRVWRVSQIKNVNFDQPEVTLEAYLEFPQPANTIGNLYTLDSSCGKGPALANLQKVSQARVVQGSVRGTTQNGSKMNVRIYDQKLNMQSPTNFSGRIKPVRLGEQ